MNNKKNLIKKIYQLTFAGSFSETILSKITLTTLYSNCCIFLKELWMFALNTKYIKYSFFENISFSYRSKSVPYFILNILLQHFYNIVHNTSCITDNQFIILKKNWVTFAVIF